MDRGIMANWLERRTGRPVNGSGKLLINGDTFFPRFAEAVEGARKSVEIKTYIFDNDDVAKSVADRLRARSDEVTIRILYDSIGTRRAWRADAPSLPPDHVYEAPDMIRHLQTGGRIQLRRARHTLLTSEHAKYIVVDDSVAFFGGMNIGREYRYDWRDAMFELSGPVVDALRDRFDRAWLRAGPLSFEYLRSLGRDRPGDTGTGDLYMIETTPVRAHIYRGQVRAIKHARQRIYVENPYLWNQEILYRLCAARKRGVDVRVVIPGEVNLGVGVSANRMAVRRLLEHGVRVFVYPGMTHVKAAVYDQWACFGSANFDDLSLHKNYELNLFTDNPEVVRSVAEDLLIAGQELSDEVLEADPVTLIDMFIARFAEYL
jgi:cardiolipin synthase